MPTPEEMATALRGGALQGRPFDSDPEFVKFMSFMTGHFPGKIDTSQMRPSENIEYPLPTLDYGRPLTSMSNEELDERARVMQETNRRYKDFLDVDAENILNALRAGEPTPPSGLAGQAGWGDINGGRKP